jgi:hypothetical protein
MRRFNSVVFIVTCAATAPAWGQYTNSYVLSNAVLGNVVGGEAALENDIGASCTAEQCGNTTAFGYFALGNEQNAYGNTAVGAFAVSNNITGSENSGLGLGALAANTTGGLNTAVGAGSAATMTTALQNTAVGADALGGNGSNNTAVGYDALGGINSSTGSANSAFGVFALSGNTSGNYNVAAGSETLMKNTSGSTNLGFGIQALYSNTTGNNNIGVGYAGGYSLTTGSNNIDIGNVGVAGESGAIRIGTAATTKTTYISGITGVTVAGSGTPVVVNSNGQLGIQGSSERFKTAITPMGDTTAKLEQLRPVTFQYKSDPQRAKQYGLIAEQVAKVYPELVVRDANGRIISVRYDELAPMILNEMLQQNKRLTEQNEQLDEKIRELETAVLKLQRSRAQN